jgi:hypothetical protein
VIVPSALSVSTVGVPAQPVQPCAPFALTVTLDVVAPPAPTWSLPSTEPVVPPATLPTPTKLSSTASTMPTLAVAWLFAALPSLPALVVPVKFAAVAVTSLPAGFAGAV